MTEAKFTSFTTCDFLNDVDLDFLLIRGINLYPEQQHQLCSWHKSP